MLIQNTYNLFLSFLQTRQQVNSFRFLVVKNAHKKHLWFFLVHLANKNAIVYSVSQDSKLIVYPVPTYANPIEKLQSIIKKAYVNNYSDKENPGTQWKVMHFVQDWNIGNVNIISSWKANKIFQYTNLSVWMWITKIKFILLYGILLTKISLPLLYKMNIFINKNKICYTLMSKHS